MIRKSTPCIVLLLLALFLVHTQCDIVSQRQIIKRLNKHQTVPKGYRTYPVPTVTEILPSIVGSAGGTPVTLCGSNFLNHKELMFFIEVEHWVRPARIASHSVVVHFPRRTTEPNINLPVWACSTSFKASSSSSSSSSGTALWLSFPAKKTTGPSHNCVIVTSPTIGVTYSDPIITSVTPKFWCRSGITRLTLTGKYFGSGDAAAGYYHSAYVKSELSAAKNTVLAVSFDPTSEHYRINSKQLITGTLTYDMRATPIEEDFTLTWTGGSGSFTIEKAGNYIDC